MTLVLASASPRRATLLRSLVDDFTVAPADIDEVIAGPHVTDAVRSLAARKAAAAALRWPGAIVLAADTVVVLDGAVLGQPADGDDARRMLLALDGRSHDVVTGVAWCRRAAVTPGAAAAPADRAIAAGRAVAAASTVRLDMAAVLAPYLASGAWRGKAGAYGLQDAAIAGVATLESGAWSTVVGLPLSAAAALLREAGVPCRDPPDEGALAQHNPFL